MPEWHNESGNTCNRRGKLEPCLHPLHTPELTLNLIMLLLLFLVLPSNLMLLVKRENMEITSTFFLLVMAHLVSAHEDSLLRRIFQCGAGLKVALSLNLFL